MGAGADLGTAKVTTSSNNVGEQGVLSLSFGTPVPIRSSDIIVITIPEDVTPPDRSSIKCTGDGVIMLASLKCTVNNQVVSIVVSPKSTSAT